MWQQNKNSKCCATCANWGGDRTAKHTWAEVEHPDTRGECYANVFCGVTSGPCACQGRSCDEYQLWSAID